MTNTLRRIGAVLVPTALAISLAACGGGSGRPSADEIEKSLKSAMGTSMSDAQLKCLAKVFHDSDISDKALRQVVSGDDADVSNDDKKAEKAVEPDIKKCLGDDSSALSDAQN